MDRRNWSAAIVLLSLSVASFGEALLLPAVEHAFSKADPWEVCETLSGGSVLWVFPPFLIWAGLYALAVGTTVLRVLRRGDGRARRLALFWAGLLVLIQVPIALLDRSAYDARILVGGWLWFAVVPLLFAALWHAPTWPPREPLAVTSRASIGCALGCLLLALTMVAPAATVTGAGSRMLATGFDVTVNHTPIIPVNVALTLLPLPFLALLRTREPIWRISGIAIALAALAVQLLILVFPGATGVQAFHSGAVFWVGSPSAFLYAFWIVPAVPPTARERSV